MERGSRRRVISSMDGRTKAFGWAGRLTKTAKSSGLVQGRLWLHLQVVWLRTRHQQRKQLSGRSWVTGSGRKGQGSRSKLKSTTASSWRTRLRAVCVEQYAYNFEELNQSNRSRSM